MFSHVMVGSSDIESSKKFYDAVMAAIAGREPMVDMKDGKTRLFYIHNGSIFAVTEPIDGESATHANGGTVGFNCESPEQADAWHKAGIENGGTAIEDPPGEREVLGGKLYLAYLRDPDGNKLCATYRMG